MTAGAELGPCQPRGHAASSVVLRLAMAPEAGTACRVRARGGELPCASGTYSPQEAGTRTPYQQHGGPGVLRTCQHGRALGDRLLLRDVLHLGDALGDLLLLVDAPGEGRGDR